MKKIVKLSALLAVVGVGVLSGGCSCKLKKDKLNTRAEAMASKELAPSSDFVITNKIVDKQENDEKVITIKETSYRMEKEGTTIKISVTEKSGIEGEELATVSTSTLDIYQENNRVYINRDKQKIETAYTSSWAYYIDSGYHDVFVKKYDEYKITPYHGCAEVGTKGDPTQVPYILKNSISKYNPKDDTLTCSAKRKVFGKEATYKVRYRVSISQITEVEILSDKNDKLKRVIEDTSIGVIGGKAIDRKITFNVEYN